MPFTDGSSTVHTCSTCSTKQSKLCDYWSLPGQCRQWENSVRLLLSRYSVELMYFMLLVIIRTRIHIRVIVNCWLVYLGNPCELQIRRLTAIHAPCSLHFLLQNLVTFPVIFRFSVYSVLQPAVDVCVDSYKGPCFTKCLIFKLNLNETQLVIKAMLKTSSSAFIIELSIPNLPLVYMSNARSGHISLLKEFTCKIHQFRLYSAHLIVIYIPSIYPYALQCPSPYRGVLHGHRSSKAALFV